MSNFIEFQKEFKTLSKQELKFINAGEDELCDDGTGWSPTNGYIPPCPGVHFCLP